MADVKRVIFGTEIEIFSHTFQRNLIIFDTLGEYFLWIQMNSLITFKLPDMRDSHIVPLSCNNPFVLRTYYQQINIRISERVKMRLHDFGVSKSTHLFVTSYL